MKTIEFMKPHVGQWAKAGDIKTVTDEVAKHLIRFGYARESGSEGIGETPKKAGTKS